MVTKKKSGSFDYFKPQNGADALMLSQSNSSDSQDSDSKSMFALPKRRIIRPKGSLGGRAGSLSCCRFVCVTVLPVFAALAFVGLVACLIFLLLGMNGLQRDLELIRLRINQVEADDDSNLQASTKLQQDLNGKLAALANDEREIGELRQELKATHSKIEALNRTIISLKLHMTKAGSVASLSADVNELKKGMADTGVELHKLTDQQNSMKMRNDKLVSIVKTINQKMFNITEKLLAKASFGPVAPPLPKLPGFDSLPHQFSDLATRLSAQKKQWEAGLKNHSGYMKMELYKLYSFVDVVNTTCHSMHADDATATQQLWNRTALLQAQWTAQMLPLIGAVKRLGNGSRVAAGRALDNSSLHQLIDDVDQHRVQLINITDRLTHLEQFAAQPVNKFETTSLPITSTTTARSPSDINTSTSNTSVAMTTPVKETSFGMSTPAASKVPATEETFETLAPVEQTITMKSPAPRTDGQANSFSSAESGMTDAVSRLHNVTGLPTTNSTGSSTNTNRATVGGISTASDPRPTQQSHSTRNLPVENRFDSLEDDFNDGARDSDDSSLDDV